MDISPEIRTHTQPTEFGKKDQQQKNAVVYENYDGKTNYDSKNMLSCIRLVMAKLDWLIGKTIMCIAT